MKKTVSIMLAALLLVVMGACTSGGAAGDGKNAAAGTYTIKSMSAAGVEVDVEAALSEAGVSTDDFKIELKEDGKLSLSVFNGSETITEEGTWTADGNKITMVAETSTSEATLDGNKLTMDEDGTVMVFEKK